MAAVLLSNEVRSRNSGVHATSKEACSNAGVVESTLMRVEGGIERNRDSLSDIVGCASRELCQACCIIRKLPSSVGSKAARCFNKFAQVGDDGATEPGARDGTMGAVRDGGAGDAQVIDAANLGVLVIVKTGAVHRASNNAFGNKLVHDGGTCGLDEHVDVVVIARGGSQNGSPGFFAKSTNTCSSRTSMLAMDCRGGDRCP